MSSVGVSYRYGHKQSKVSIYPWLFSELCSHVGSKKAANKVIRDAAIDACQREVSCSKNAKLKALQLVISPRYLTGYKESLEDHEVSCNHRPKGGRHSSSDVQIPDAMMYALNLRFSNGRREVRNCYSDVVNVLGSKETDESVSNLVRERLFKLLRN